MSIKKLTYQELSAEAERRKAEKKMELEAFKASLIKEINYCIRCNRKVLETMEMDSKTEDEIALEIEMYEVFKKMINNKVKITKGKDK